MHPEVILALIKKNLAIVCSAVVLIACGVVYWLRMDLKTELEGEKEHLDLKMTGYLRDLKNSNGLEDDNKEFDAVMEELDSRLFDKQDKGSSLSYFLQIRDESGVRLRGSPRPMEYKPVVDKKKPKKPKNNDASYDIIKYEMVAVGEFSQLVEFLRRLEGGPSFYRLETFEMKPAGRQSGGLALDISLLMLAKKTDES